MFSLTGFTFLSPHGDFVNRVFGNSGACVCVYIGYIYICIFCDSKYFYEIRIRERENGIHVYVSVYTQI